MGLFLWLGVHFGYPTNRNGAFSLGWIVPVPVRLSGEHGRPRAVRISLRLRNKLQARAWILQSVLCTSPWAP